MKKIFCVILAVLFVMISTIPALAEEEPDIADENTAEGRRMQIILLVGASVLALVIVTFEVVKGLLLSK